MTKATKIWLVTAFLLVVIGCLFFGGAMMAAKWDFSKLSAVKFETNEHEIGDEFSSISVKTDTSDITFVLSDNEKCKVECYEEEKAKHYVAVEGDTLVIKTIDEKSWYDYIGFNFTSPKIKVYLPKTEYSGLFIKESTGDVEIPKGLSFEGIDITLKTGDVSCFASATKLIKIKTSTGSICVEDTYAPAFELSASTGRITASNLVCNGDLSTAVTTGKTNLTDIKCKNLISKGSTGDISINSVIATEKISIKSSTGDIRFDDSDAAEIAVETDTGDVTGSLLTDKVFLTHTDTGKCDVPKTTVGGKCEITTDTGDIRVTVKT